MSTRATMQLQVLLPTEVLIDEPVVKVVAEAQNGSFCLLPRHIDFVAALVPSVLCFWATEEDERFAAIDEGILVKCAHEVFVSSYSAVQDKSLDRLQTLVGERFLKLTEHERRTRSALARLEAGTLRGFHELLEQTYE